MFAETLEKSAHQSRLAARNASAFQEVLRAAFGVSFTCFDAATGLNIDAEGDAADGGLGLDPATVIRLAAAGQAVVVPNGRHHFRISLVLHAAGKPILVASGAVPALAEAVNSRAMEQARLQTWAQDFSERLRLGDQLSQRAKVEEDLRGQLHGAWQVNLTLGDSMRRLHFNRHEDRDRHRILEAALKLLDAEALLWVPGRSEGDILIVGQTHVTRKGALKLASCLAKEPGAREFEPIFCNDPLSKTWGGAIPEFDNLMALNVAGKTLSSWVIALNKRGKARTHSVEGDVPRMPFRNSDAAVLSPFVSLLEMHANAAGKFDELRSLFVGLARSFTAAIDAKDAYTAGHSERVARLAIEIGRELRLPNEQLSDTYLAGLLHDIGKIGIREAVLCKPGRLTPEEFDHKKQHVTIGCHILQDLQALGQLLPGVLYHHERFDGKGYPEGLVGDAIPFLARLLAVADGFDAMNSNRPCRPALSHSQVFEELKKGAGIQWDPQIVAAAVNCGARLVTITSRGVGESLHQAVQDALRMGDSSMLAPTPATLSRGDGNPCSA
jgi:HD-GYP domain-containing protein (c-di-GMP phosphodiesterase class II)